MIKKGRKGKRAYLHEHFTAVCILYGNIKCLEEIKVYIAQNYVRKGLLGFIRPTYSKKPLCAVNELQYSENQVCTGPVDRKMDGEDFYLAFVMRGEVKYLEQVKEYIGTYTGKGLVELEMTPYTKEKQYILEI